MRCRFEGVKKGMVKITMPLVFAVLTRWIGRLPI